MRATAAKRLTARFSAEPKAAVSARTETLSIIVPVYQGEATLSPLLQELSHFTAESKTAKGHPFRITEVILVNDGAIDDSRSVMHQLAKTYPFVRLIWLSRNYGQHAATLAGMSSTVSDWVVTMDEDGQQNPADIARMLEIALRDKTHLVYANPSNGLPHDGIRNVASRAAKWVFSRLLGNSQLGKFNSFRLMRGNIARSLAAYCGSHVYLDGALHWVTERPAYCNVELRRDGARTSGYSYPKLFDHFMRLVFTSKRPPLRIVTFLGCLSLLLSIGMAAMAVWEKYHHQVPVQGWTSLVILISFFSGLLLFSAGLIAEYLGILVSMSMGKPLYLIIPDSLETEDRE
jgi:undecaprenyl-phosphate 4-deoxy-4-formamido-L-arabinose transferase